MANCLYAATRSTAIDYTGRHQALDHVALASTRHPVAVNLAMVDNSSLDTVEGLRRPMHPNLRPTFAKQTLWADDSRHTVGLRRPCAAMGGHGPSMSERLLVDALPAGRSPR